MLRSMNMGWEYKLEKNPVIAEFVKCCQKTWAPVHELAVDILWKTQYVNHADITNP